MADQKQTTFVSMTLTLLLVTLAASTLLGFVYEVTKSPIELSRLEKKKAAINNVVPSFDNNPISESYEVTSEGEILRFYPAKKNGELVGVAVETYSKKGFSGLVQLMVGFLPDGTINDVTVLSHKETPGLGDKMSSEWNEQFQGKNPENFKLKVSKDGGDVDAITAATISSRAFTDAVERAYVNFKEKKQ